MIAEAALLCLALNVYHEARGDSPEAQVNTAQVVLNRVESARFPSTICGVVKQRNSRGCQFSWWCDGRSDRPREKGAWKRAKAVAARALEGLEVDATGGATHYHSHAVSPYWAPSMDRVHADDAHIFYREN